MNTPPVQTLPCGCSKKIVEGNPLTGIVGPRTHIHLCPMHAVEKWNAVAEESYRADSKQEVIESVEPAGK